MAAAATADLARTEVNFGSSSLTSDLLTPRCPFCTLSDRRGRLTGGGGGGGGGTGARPPAPAAAVLVAAPFQVDPTGRRRCRRCRRRRYRGNLFLCARAPFLRLPSPPCPTPPMPRPSGASPARSLPPLKRLLPTGTWGHTWTASIQYSTFQILPPSIMQLICMRTMKRK